MSDNWTYSSSSPLNISKEDAERALIRMYPEVDPDVLIHQFYNGGVEIKMGALLRLMRKSKKE